MLVLSGHGSRAGFLGLLRKIRMAACPAGGKPQRVFPPEHAPSCLLKEHLPGLKGREGEKETQRQREGERTIYLFVFGGDSFLSHLSLIFGSLCYTGCSQSISMVSIVLTSYLWLHSYLPTYLSTHIQSYPFSAREQTWPAMCSPHPPDQSKQDRGEMPCV